MNKQGKLDARTKYTPLDLESFIQQEGLSTFLNALPQQFWILTPKGFLVYAGQRSTDYFGISLNELIKRQWQAFVHTEDLAALQQRLKKSFLSGEDCAFEFRLKDGASIFRWHIFRAAALRDAAQEILFWIVTLADISARKEIESALAISNTSLSAAQAHGKIGSWQRDLVTQKGEWSPEMYRLFGRQPEQNPPSFAESVAMIHVDDRAEFVNLHDAYLKEGKNYSYDFRLPQPDGSDRWIEARSETIRDAQGNAIALRGTAQDITERKNFEAALLDREAKLNNSQAIAKMGSWELDIATKKVFRSEELTNVTTVAYEDDAFNMQRTIEKLHPDDVEKFKTYYESITKRVGTSSSEFRIILPDGNIRWVMGHDQTIGDEQGNPIRAKGILQDITERKMVEFALNASESRFSAFMEKWPALAFIKNEAQQFIYINPAFERIFNVKPSDIINKTVFEIYPLEIAQRLHDHDAAIFASGKQTEAYEDVPTPEGMRHWLSVKFIFSNARGERFLGATAIDLTERHSTEQQLIASRHLLETSQSIAKLGGWEFDLDNQLVLWNDEIYHILDTDRDHHTPTFDNGMHRFINGSRERLREAIEQTASTGAPFDLELEMLTDKQRAIHVRITGTAKSENGKVSKLTGILQDISTQKMAQLALETANSDLAYANKVLENIAHYDPLTHLPNRVLLSDRMSQAMIHNQRNETTLAVAFLDLDGFKSVNDQYGHSVGDKFLIGLAHRMKQSLREGDTLARIGGDEFVVVLSDLKADEHFEPLLARLLKAASEPFLVDQTPLAVTASIGVTLYPQDNVDAEQLLRHADQAMYLAKQAGKNCFHLFDIVRDTAVKTQRETLEQIRKALHNNEFVLYYQPKVNMRDGTLVGAEALIRWQHPERGLIPPALFLPVIENHIYSIEMGEWVIARALKQMSEWQEKGLRIPVSVNIGALQLQQPNFPQRLQFLLAQQAHIKPNELELEILETSALEDITQVSATINACKELGVTFALDDFGTGYASLAYLKRLPAELLKIDQTFVRDMLDDPDDLAIIQGIIGLAKAFQRQVIAEGVETIAHGKKLLSLGCELAQGYGIAKPMPAAALPEWLSSWRPDSTWTQ